MSNRAQLNAQGSGLALTALGVALDAIDRLQDHGPHWPLVGW